MMTNQRFRRALWFAIAAGVALTQASSCVVNLPPGLTLVNPLGGYCYGDDDCEDYYEDQEDYYDELEDWWD